MAATSLALTPAVALEAGRALLDCGRVDDARDLTARLADAGATIDANYYQAMTLHAQRTGHFDEADRLHREALRLKLPDVFLFSGNWHATTQCRLSQPNAREIIFADNLKPLWAVAVGLGSPPGTCPAATHDNVIFEQQPRQRTRRQQTASRHAARAFPRPSTFSAAASADLLRREL
eukprot:6192711-Pleurochrysis_carterae.AAC.1